MVLTLRLCVLYGLYGPCETSTHWSRITEVDSVYCAVRIESLHKTETFLLKRVKAYMLSEFKGVVAGNTAI